MYKRQIVDGDLIYFVSSQDNPACRSRVDIVAPATCSGDCEITAVADDPICDDNGTPLNPRDDTFTVNATIDGINAGTTWVSSFRTSGTFGVETVIGPLRIANGKNVICIHAEKDRSCILNLDLIPPATCSDDCKVTVASVSEGLCDNNGTPLDPSDDTFTFTAIIEGIQAGTSWTSSDGVTGLFDEQATFGPYPISEGNAIITISADDDPSCTINLEATPPATCSDGCEITAIASEGVCDDSGTPLDPSDDTFTFMLTVDGIEAGDMWIGSDSTTGSFNIETKIGPFNIEDGNLIYFVSSEDNPACKARVDVIAPAACSDDCLVTVTEDHEPKCDDNGTPLDPSDDTFTIRVKVNGIQAGKTFTSSDGTTGNFNSTTPNGPFNIADGDVTLTYTSDSNPTCSASVMVEAPATCSDDCQSTDNPNCGNIAMLKLTEIMYNPKDFGDTPSSELEFLELKNTSEDASIDLTGVKLTGVEFNFPRGTILLPQEIIVIASNAAELKAKSPDVEIFGEYMGQLNDDGGTITLDNTNREPILSITYDDVSPWPEAADGNGYSLVPVDVNPVGDQDHFSQWTVSNDSIYGSPGVDESMTSSINSGIIKMHETDIYPNPIATNSKLIVESMEPIEAIKIFSHYGKLVVSPVLQQQRNRYYTESPDTPGLYILQITYSDGSLTSKSLIVH